MIKFITIGLAILISLTLAAFFWFFFVRFTPSDRKALTKNLEGIEINNVRRTYRVQNGSREEARPLIVALHGYRDKGRWIELYSGLSNLAKEENFTVVYPEGQRMSWNGEFCCGYAYKHRVEDVDFIRQLIDRLKDDYRIDDRKVYVVGFSNGGLFAQRLLKELPVTFAAGASVMSGIGDGNTQLDISAARAPIMLVNGSQDPYTQSGSAGESFSFTTPETTTSAWTQHYQATLESQSTKEGFIQKIYRAKGKKKVVSRLYNEQHRWPDWRLWSFSAPVSEFSRDMWDFFDQFQRD